MIENSFLQELIKKPDQISKLEFDDISKILVKAKNIFESEDLLLELSVEESNEIYVLGDIRVSSSSSPEIWCRHHMRNMLYVWYFGL